MAPTTDLTKGLAAAGIPFRFALATADKLHANPWNPNKMDDRTMQAARESVATFGFIDPVTVREHPDLDGHFQIIDGEHRWRVATELHGDTPPVLPLVILEVDDTAAKKLTIILNETRGESDTIVLGTLLKELQGVLGDDLSVGLRYDDGELAHLLALGDQDWDQYGDGGFPGDHPGGDDGEWVTIPVRMPAEAVPVWEEVRGQVFEAGDVNDGHETKVANGLILEVICATYLASSKRDRKAAAAAKKKATST